VVTVNFFFLRFKKFLFLFGEEIFPNENGFLKKYFFLVFLGDRWNDLGQLRINCWPLLIRKGLLAQDNRSDKVVGWRWKIQGQIKS
jgi:hypothetical protein